MKKLNKKIIYASIIILLIGLAGLGIYLKQVSDYQHKVSELSIQNISLQSIKDGVYKGECDVHFIKAAVEVTIKDGKYVQIILVEHKNDRGKAAEVIIDEVMAQQSLNVDIVSGATNSSKVILKAIETALISEIK
ncbi:MAG: FMN-binding protein [Beduini sp.]|uniref:FMN-binding protein n=1 Tax=Beduini sp. TaxID=1922300 RepID=UPI0011CBEA83